MAATVPERQAEGAWQLLLHRQQLVQRGVVPRPEPPRRERQLLLHRGLFHRHRGRGRQLDREPADRVADH